MLASYWKADLQSERGAALLLTMILMLVFSLLTVSLYELLEASTQIAGNHIQDLKAVCAADAGVEDAINQLLLVEATRDSTDPVVVTGGLSSGGTYTATIMDAATPNPTFSHEKDIVSTGTFLGVTRQIETHIGIIKSYDSKGDPVYAVATASWILRPPSS